MPFVLEAEYTRNYSTYIFQLKNIYVHRKSIINSENMTKLIQLIYVFHCHGLFMLLNLDKYFFAFLNNRRSFC